MPQQMYTAVGRTLQALRLVALIRHPDAYGQ